MRRGGLLSLSPAAYISANNRPAPAAGGVGSPPSSRPSPVALTGAGVLGDRYVPTVGCKTPIADVLCGAACADVEVMEVPTVGCKTPIAVVLNVADCADDDGMDVPTVGYMTPIADAVLADTLSRMSKELVLSLSIIESRMVAV